MFDKRFDDRERIKDRIKGWIGVSGDLHSNKTLFDAAIMETFFYIYNSLEDGMKIQEIGDKLGVLRIA